MMLGECRIDQIGLLDLVESSRLCVAIMTTPNAVTREAGRWTSTESTIIAHPSAHRTLMTVMW